MASNMFLKIDGVKGNSTDSNGKDQIELLSFSHGVSMNLAAAGSASGASMKPGRCNHQDMTISKYLDGTSPVLNLKCSAGDNIKTMEISLWQADAGGASINYWHVLMEDCLVTSVSIGGSGMDLPCETVSWHYNKITWTYTPQKTSAPGGGDGKIPTCWDLELNKKG